MLYQNKNAVLSSALLKFAEDHKIHIERKYLTKGISTLHNRKKIKKLRHLLTIRLPKNYKYSENKAISI